MVRPMIDKFNEYRLVNSGSTMPSGDKQQSVLVKKVALRELPSETTNIISKHPGNSPISKDRGTNVDFLKVSSAKRKQSDSPSSPSTQPFPCNTGTNGHLVYVRRKLDIDTGKTSSEAGSPESRKYVNGSTKETNVNGSTKERKVQRDPIQEPKASPLPVRMPVPASSPSTTSSGGPSLSYTPKKPNIVLAVPESNDSLVTTVSPVQADSQKPISQHWKERFLRLQMFLKHCDQSSQEEYLKMLRSLSAVGRSRHAVELEKRAIQLMLEEGKELHRMKVLNVLGKALPKDDASISTQIPLTKENNDREHCRN